MLRALRQPSQVHEPAARRIALAGNPNSGKTSLFNALTGAHQRVGNYPGVTVEKRVGRFAIGQDVAELIDLPGTYSLTAYSPEERIAEDALLEGEVDVVVVVVDSTALRRGLVLLAQVLLTGANPVLCLNMADEARRAGQRLDLAQMRALLGVPVVETSAHRGEGVEALRAAVETAISAPLATHRLRLGPPLDRALDELVTALDGTPLDPRIRPWVASRLLIGEPRWTERMRLLGRAGEHATQHAGRLRHTAEAITGQAIDVLLSERTFGYANGLVAETLLRAPRADARALSDAVDRVLVHRWLGVPIFAAAMYAIFWITFTVGAVPMGWIEAGFGALGAWIGGLWPAGADAPLRSLLVDGVIGGVGGVIVFLPNIVLLFLGLALLEDTGYMARVAFLTDRLMHRVGLHGKSFVPMVTGFGCSIPGILATRTLENERDRLTTMLVLPLMSCGARLPIWMLLVPAFFPATWRAPALFGIYATGIALAFALALLLRRSVLRGEDAPFVMELPPYRLPTVRSVVTKMGERSWVYLRKAGTVILGISVLMWFVTAYPKKPHHDVDAAVAAGAIELDAAAVEAARAAEDLEHSLAGRVGHALEPLVRPLGFDWKLATGMVGAFAAKEVFVAQMGIVYALGEVDEQSTGLRGALARDYSPLTGVSLMLFLLIATPCMATLAVTRRESGSWRWAALQFGGLTGVAYLLSLLVYQLGSRLV